MTRYPELSTVGIGDKFAAMLFREYSLSPDEIHRINAVIEAWGEEQLIGSLSDARRDLCGRVLRVLGDGAAPVHVEDEA